MLAQYRSVTDRERNGQTDNFQQHKHSFTSAVSILCQGKGNMNTYWLVGENSDPQTEVQLKQLLREVRKDGKQLRHAL